MWGITQRGHDHDIADYEIYLWQVGTPPEKAARLTYHSGNDRWPDIFIPGGASWPRARMRLRSEGGAAVAAAGARRRRSRRNVRMRIAVLGAGGFVGSHLVPAGSRARPRTEIDAVDRDLRQARGRPAGRAADRGGIDAPGLVDELTGGADVVVSLTALCNPSLYNTQPLDVIDASYTDLLPVVKLCAARGRWLIHFSTCEVYGRTALDASGRPTRTMDEDETAMFLGPVQRERWTYAPPSSCSSGSSGPTGVHAGLEHSRSSGPSTSSGRAWTSSRALTAKASPACSPASFTRS